MSKITMWLGLVALLIIFLWCSLFLWNSCTSFSEMDEAFARPSESLTGESAIYAISKYTSFTNANLDENVTPNDIAFFWDGGSFNGINAFWAYQCNSLESCWNTLLSTEFLSRDDFQPFTLPTIQILEQGPWERSVADKWKLKRIRNGVYCLRIIRERVLFFAAIDFDKSTVYGSYQSGGF